MVGRRYDGHKPARVVDFIVVFAGTGLTLSSVSAIFFRLEINSFRNPKVGAPVQPRDPLYVDESVPANPDMDRGSPMVVFGDHRLCGGISTRVQRMPWPHMHSQIEINVVTSGSITYWFDGRRLTVNKSQIVLFWGMVPHQVVACAKNTEFVVLYVPMSAFLTFPSLSRLRHAIFSGAMIEALQVRPSDAETFNRWRLDLNSRDEQLSEIVRDELTARLRRMDREGWRDIRGLTQDRPQDEKSDPNYERVLKVERMARFIGERALDPITADDVAREAGLHPNYAMTLFKRTMGLTIKQSIIRHRLDMARSMLIATDLPVVSIAFDSGFRSLSSFYEAFERRFKTIPTAFRTKFAESSME